RQLAGEAAKETLRDRMSHRKLPRREFVLRSELAALAISERLPSAEALLVAELDARSALLAVRVIRGQPKLRLALLERAILGFLGEPYGEEAARFELEARLRSVLLRLEAQEPGTDALIASLRFDLANPERSGERAIELIFFSSAEPSAMSSSSSPPGSPSGLTSSLAAADRALSVRGRALRRFDNLVRAAQSRASAQDR
ncbi:MAG: hypothetical protein AAF368_08670, partial [Planctomycetota bacterium]